MKVCQHCGAPARSEEQKCCGKCGHPFEMAASEPEAPVRVRVPRQSKEEAPVKAEEPSKPISAPERKEEPVQRKPVTPEPAPVKAEEPSKPVSAPERKEEPVQRKPVTPTPAPVKAEEPGKPVSVPERKEEPVQRKPVTPKPAPVKAEEPSRPVSAPERKEEPVQRKPVTPKPETPTVPDAPPVQRTPVRSEPVKSFESRAAEPAPVPPARSEKPSPAPSPVPAQAENVSLHAEDAQSTPAEAFFQSQPELDVPVVSTQDIPDAPADVIAEEPVPRPKKRFPKVLLILLILVLAAALLGGGFLLWTKIQQSKNATIGGTSYSIKDTTSLVVTSPSDEDWLNLCRLSNLTSLTITGNVNLDAGKLESLGALQALTSLSVDGAAFPDGLAALPMLPALDSLSLTNCGLSSEQCSGINLPASLRKLCLSNNALTDLSFLQGLVQLEELSLDGNRITDYTPIAALTGLTTLCADHCQISVCNSLSALQKLTVNGQEIADPTAYLANLNAVIKQDEELINLFENSDFDALTSILQQREASGSPADSTVIYANGWLMDNGSEWDIIRSSLPSGSQMLLSDASGLYYGQMNGKNRSGNGIQLFAGNHSIYNGLWSNDMPNGTGTYRKTTADGTTLEFAGNYTDGYENGSMTFTVTNDAGTKSGTYTAVNGTRATVEQLGSEQFAFIQFNTTYWYDASPDGHGVEITSIPYQEEKSVEILPKEEAKPSASGSKSKSGSKNNGGAASGAQQPGTPAEQTPSADSSSDSRNITPEEAWRRFQEGVRTATDIFRAAKEFGDMFS